MWLLKEQIWRNLIQLILLRRKQKDVQTDILGVDNTEPTKHLESFLAT